MNMFVSFQPRLTSVMYSLRLRNIAAFLKYWSESELVLEIVSRSKLLCYAAGRLLRELNLVAVFLLYNRSVAENARSTQLLRGDTASVENRETEIVSYTGTV